MSIYKISRKISLIIGLTSTLLLIAPLFQRDVQAGLPPRPSFPQEKSNDEPVGAMIELQVWPIKSTLWTVVQWQDDTGQWHDVAGWQGHLDSGIIFSQPQGRIKRWWVDARDFGKGPFQWQVYEAKNGKLLTQSEPFLLPDEVGETVLKQISLP